MISPPPPHPDPIEHILRQLEHCRNVLYAHSLLVDLRVLKPDPRTHAAAEILADAIEMIEFPLEDDNEGTR